MGTNNNSSPSMIDLEGLAQDMARLEMDRDSCDIIFVVSFTCLDAKHPSTE